MLIHTNRPPTSTDSIKHFVETSDNSTHNMYVYTLYNIIFEYKLCNYDVKQYRKSDSLR